MQCKKCKSTDVNVQVVTKTKKKGKGFYYWTVGWIVNMVMWFFLTLPMLLKRVFGKSKDRYVTKTQKMAICQSCGHSWKV